MSKTMALVSGWPRPARRHRTRRPSRPRPRWSPTPAVLLILGLAAQPGDKKGVLADRETGRGQSEQRPRCNEARCSMMGDMTKSKPNFDFFRSYPDGEEDCKALTSSMQTLESVLLLIALKRYPHALCTCVAAVESALKSSRLSSALARTNGLGRVLEVVRRESAELAEFPQDQLKALGGARNRFTHAGFSPRDDSEAVGLLIEVGIPFLSRCYQHLYSFDLLEALHEVFAHQWRNGAGVFQRAKRISILDRSYCLNSLGHLIRWSLKERFSADWEINGLAIVEASWGSFDFQSKVRRKLELSYSTCWVFNCSLCRGIGSCVCELDNDELELRNIIPLRMTCTNCGFVVHESEPFLSEAVMKETIAQEREKILKDCGLL